MIDRYFLPDIYCDTVFDIKAEALASRGIKGVILDIDNTLVPYEIPTPTPEVSAWLASLEAMGISAAFVSNNHADRVELFNRELKYFAIADSGKPGKKSLLLAMEHMGTDRKSTAVIGDQIFTDIFAGKRLCLYSALVKPIKDKKTLFFRFKRWLEKPVIKRYNKMKKEI